MATDHNISQEAAANRPRDLLLRLNREIGISVVAAALDATARNGRGREGEVVHLVAHRVTEFQQLWREHRVTILAALALLDVRPASAGAVQEEPSGPASASLLVGAIFRVRCQRQASLSNEPRSPTIVG